LDFIQLETFKVLETLYGFVQLETFKVLETLKVLPHRTVQLMMGGCVHSARILQHVIDDVYRFPEK